MRAAQLDQLGDDVAALRAAGFRVVVDLHGDLEGLAAALTGAHAEAGGAATAGVYWTGHGSESGAIATYDGGSIAPEQLPAEVAAKAQVKLFVMSACYAGAHQPRWQKALGPQALVVGWGAAITRERATEFLTHLDASSKGFDKLLERHLGVCRVAADGALAQAKDLSRKHQDRVAVTLLSFDRLVVESATRLKCAVQRTQGGAAYFVVATEPSKDRPNAPRSQAVRVAALGAGDSWIHVASIVGPHSEALDLARALRELGPWLHVRVTLDTISPPGREFVLVDTLLRRRGLDHLTLSTAILTVGSRADRLEDMFFGTDQR
jgi:hypothetical protein